MNRYKQREKFKGEHQENIFEEDEESFEIRSNGTSSKLEETGDISCLQ